MLVNYYVEALKGQEKYTEAIDILKKVINIKENKPTSEPLHLAFFYNSLGCVYRDNTIYDLALQYYYKCLKIYENKLGGEDL